MHISTIIHRDFKVKIGHIGNFRFFQMYIVIVFIFLSILLVCCRKDEKNEVHNNWQTIYQNNNLDYITVKFLDKDTGYVIATDLTSFKEVILFTENGGNSWSIDTCLLPTNDDLIRDMFPLDKGIILGVGYYVYKSRDNGKTWANISPQFGGPIIYDLNVIDSITWVVARDYNIYRTSNAGQTWQTVSDELPPSGQFSFPTSSAGYAWGGYFNCGVTGIGPCVDYGNIAKTTDAGQSWVILKPEPWNSNNITIPDITALQFITDQIGYMSTFNDYKLYKTVDGGYNWTLVHNNKKIGLEHFISENIGYCTDGTTIEVSKNGGITWEVDYSIGTDYVTGGIIAWTFLETGEGYALTRDHRIIKNIQ